MNEELRKLARERLEALFREFSIPEATQEAMRQAFLAPPPEAANESG